jgi:hypothetical protein
MFIRYFIEIPRPMAEVEPELSESPGSWSAAAARDAEERGEKLLAEVGSGLLVPPVRLPSKTLLPISWKPTGLEGLLPRPS